jgi:ribonuclease HII
VFSPTLERETALWARGFQAVAGLDEVGRGPLAGPVVAAAVVFPPGQLPIDGLRDSKLMTAAGRERVRGEIHDQALSWAIGAASVAEIDRLNIRRATILAMNRAITRLSFPPDYVLVDGNPLPELCTKHEAVVGGDAECHSIAAASVLAKCVRDRLMALLGERYPSFGWQENKGYATRVHLDALDHSGPSPHHRKSFSPVAQPRLL